MNRKWNFVRSFSHQGDKLPEKFKLAILGALAPMQERRNSFMRRVVRKLVPSMTISPKQLNGGKLSIDPGDWSQTVIFEEVFIRNGYDLNKIKFTPEMIIDCGAHIGIFSLLAKSRYPNSRSIAFEPNPENVGWVRRQLALNPSNIKLEDAAVGAEAGQLSFDAWNSHSGKLMHGPPDGFDRIKVRVVNFPQVVKDLKPGSLLLKMDIEGEEEVLMPVLMPLLPKTCAVFFETHSGEKGWRDMEALMTSNGFQVEQLNARDKYYDGFAQRG